MTDITEKELNRLIRRVRSKGAVETIEHVSGLIRTGHYHAWYVYKLAEYLFRRGEFSAAGKLLNNMRRFGEPNPLTDKLFGTWLWCTGKRKAAIAFVTRRAKFWSASFLFGHLWLMHSLSGKNREAKHYLSVARSLA